MKINPGYETLAGVLQRALDQAQDGKGSERHALGAAPFEDQTTQLIGRMISSHHGMVHQSIKKAAESLRLPAGNDVAELLGAINYLAGAVLFLERSRVPVAANDNAKPIFPELPPGFMPWDPSETMTPPTRVLEAITRDGMRITGEEANTWDEIPGRRAFEIIGYRQYD